MNNSEVNTFPAGGYLSIERAKDIFYLTDLTDFLVVKNLNKFRKSCVEMSYSAQ